MIVGSGPATGQKAPPARRRWQRFWPSLLVVVVTAALARVVHHGFFSRSIFFDLPLIDAWEFHSRALDILDGRIYLGQVSVHGPLYPFFLAGVYGLTGVHGPQAAAAAQYLLGVITVVLIFWIARRSFGPVTGLLAGLLGAVYPLPIFYEGLVLMTSLVVFLDLAGLVGLMLWRERPRGIWLVLTGLAWGMSALARPDALFLAASFCGWLLLARVPARAVPRRLADAAILAGTVLIILTPFLVRNWRLSGGLLLQDNYGLNLYIGNNPDSNGTPYLRPGPQYENLGDMPAGLGIRDLPAKNAWFVGKMAGFVREEPLRFITLQARKLYLLAGDDEITDTYAYSFLRRYSPILAFNPLGFGILLGLAAAGVTALIRGRRRLMAIPGLYLATYSAGVITTVVSSRYRMPIVPPLIILAAVGAVAVVRSLRLGAGRRRIPEIVALAFFTLVSFGARGAAPNSDAWEPWYLMGMAHKIREEYRPAEEAFRRALAVNPEYAEAAMQLGELLGWQDRQDEAETLLRKSVRLVPCYYRGLLALGDLYRRQGRLGEAEAEYQAADQCKAFRTDACMRLALLFHEKGDRIKAAYYLGRALRVDPRDADARKNWRLITGMDPLPEGPVSDMR